jgi:hypothetical protein
VRYQIAIINIIFKLALRNINSSHNWKYPYKIIASCIKVIIYYDHCQKLNILNEEQKGCVKESFGCKEQLIIDTITMEQARKNNRNIYIAFIDYKKAYDSVPHSW